MAILKEFEDLLKVALTDGVITPAERQVLLKKAVSLGMDPDEADMYIAAEVQKLEMQMDAAKKQEMGRVCPHCGTPIPQLANKCPACGEPITAEATEELKSVLNNLESALVLLKSGKDVYKSKAEVERYIREAKLYHENNPKINKLIEEVELEVAKAEKDAVLRARKEAVVGFIKQHPKVSLASVVAFVVLMIIIVVSIPTVKTDAKMCSKAIAAAVEDGDVDKAAVYFRNYDGSWSELGNSRELIEAGYAKQGRYAEAKAMEYIGEADKIIRSVLKETGDYAGYIKYKYTTVSCYEYYNSYVAIVSEWIDYLQSKGSTPAELKNIINKNAALVKKECRNEFKNQLYEYAGVE